MRTSPGPGILCGFGGAFLAADDMTYRSHMEYGATRLRIVAALIVTARERLRTLIDTRNDGDGHGGIDPDRCRTRRGRPRWWADIESMPGVMAYGDTRDQAIAAVRALALRVFRALHAVLFHFMSRWRPVKAMQLLAAWFRIGWTVAWQNGSHRRLARPGWANYTFAFHDGEGRWIILV